MASVRPPLPSPSVHAEARRLHASPDNVTGNDAGAVALLTIVDRGGQLHSLSLLLAGIDEQGRLWFDTGRNVLDDSPWTEPGARIMAAFFDPDELVYVSMAGHAVLTAAGGRARPGQVRFCLVPDTLECWDGLLPRAGLAPQTSVRFDPRQAPAPAPPVRRPRPLMDLTF